LAGYQVWNEECPVQIRYDHVGAFENYFASLENIDFYVAQNEEQFFYGFAFVFTRENDRWFAIFINSKFQNKKIGRMLLDSIKQNEKMVYGWIVDHDNYIKDDGTPYLSPKSFYVKNNFEILKEYALKNGLQLRKIKWVDKFMK
jgi:GNAT superfamily N-acetyltransferase